MSLRLVLGLVVRALEVEGLERGQRASDDESVEEQHNRKASGRLKPLPSYLRAIDDIKTGSRRVAKTARRQQIIGTQHSVVIASSRRRTAHPGDSLREPLLSFSPFQCDHVLERNDEFRTELRGPVHPCDRHTASCNRINDPWTDHAIAKSSRMGDIVVSRSIRIFLWS